MDNSSQAAASRPVRRVRCPRCSSVLQEPGAPVYQCGGCGTTLRAKNRAGSTGAVAAGSTSTPGSALLPPPPPRSDAASTSRSSTPTPPDVRSSAWRQGTDDATGGQHDVASTSRSSTPPGGTTTNSRRQARRESGDGASTSSTPDPDATAGTRLQGTDAASRRASGDQRVSEQVVMIEKREVHDDSAPPPPPAAANQEARESSEGGRPRDAAAGAEHGAPSPGASAARFSGGSKGEEAASESSLQDDSAEKMGKRQAESTDESRKKHSGGEAAVQPRYHRHREEPAPRSSAQAAAAQPARDVLLRRELDGAAAAAAGENLGPLRKKILQTVDELKGDLSELFSKSPELNAPRARPLARRPKQEGGHASGLPATARATGGHRGSAARAIKPAHVAPPPPPPRGLPSRRYRQCRADPCCHNVQPSSSCHHIHGCCRHHGRPECSSCRGYCCRPRAQQEPSAAPRKPPVPAAAAKEQVKRRRLPPRNHCRPILKGAPFIVCSSCFKLVQVPADFAVATKTVRKLRCGACSTVLTYSYRDPARKKAYYQDSVDRCSSTDGDGSELRRGGKGFSHPDPFAPFVDGFGLSSYSTDDEQPLHVSRNTSFDTVDGAKGVGRLHRLMGYGSASELLRHSPDLYESFSERTTPDVMGQYDRKGKSVWIDDDDDDDVDDSDEEDGGALKRSAARGPAWQLPWMLGKGTPAPGAIRIK
ncbi:hypothetical protein U9M48_016224 [Paspalum notatum var. saurae]|uniref:Zinc-ribbon domain-containing protein n=1 Tax=Paspalum notatum var. saurae TaxID=547442 RepID=A0AAQ3T4W8_PASNO